jgi:hypothetical protein
MIAQAEEITGRRMNITKADIDSLPDEWLQELADDCDPDGDYSRMGYSARFIVRECFDVPAVREVIEAMLTDLQTLESDYAH